MMRVRSTTRMADETQAQAQDEKLPDELAPPQGIFNGILLSALLWIGAMVLLYAFFF